MMMQGFPDEQAAALSFDEFRLNTDGFSLNIISNDHHASPLKQGDAILFLSIPIRRVRQALRTLLIYVLFT